MYPDGLFMLKVFACVCEQTGTSSGKVSQTKTLSVNAIQAFCPVYLQSSLRTRQSSNTVQHPRRTPERDANFWVETQESAKCKGGNLATFISKRQIYKT